MQIVALAMAETLESGGPAVEAVLHACAADPAEFWKPDDAFFDLLRDKRVITAFIAEAISAEAARKAESLTGKAQKDMLTATLAPDEDGTGTSWSPGWMRVPPTRHVEGAASPSADAWDRIAGLFAADTEHEFGAAPSHF